MKLNRLAGRLLLALAFVTTGYVTSSHAAEATADAAADDSLERLQAFTASIDTFTADFEQTLYDEDSTPLQVSKGTVKLKRPGRFIWNYTEPESQQIIADGEQIWLYDIGLEQVTVNAIDERLSGSPLVLLMGSAPLEEAFDILPLGESDSIDWLELTPQSTNSDFEKVFIGLTGTELAAMELRDNFGQATQIKFTNFKAGIEIEDAVFEFEPPEGVDVIGAAR
ncbi:MAG: outer membrane lipoprotein chaperone LolA [Granulosicoccus sp.]